MTLQLTPTPAVPIMPSHPALGVGGYPFDGMARTRRGPLAVCTGSHIARFAPELLVGGVW
jgi:hypothetical protein